MKRFFLLAIAVLLFFQGHAYGATVPALCNATSIQNAINSANSGDVVLINACAATTISTQINIGTTAAPFTKNITIAGAGEGRTVLVDGTSSQIFSAVVPDGYSIRVTGMTLKSYSGTLNGGVLYIQGGTTDFRIDDIGFDMTGLTGGRMVLIGSYTDPGPTYATYGVIDHNTFYVDSGSVGGDGVSVYANGNEQWTIPLSLGTGNAVYMENNNFEFPDMGDGAYDAYDGSRIVFRYNNVWNTDLGGHGHDSSLRSVVSYEIYDNNFNPPSPNLYNGTKLAWFVTRGGTGVLFNNNIVQGYSSYITLESYRSCPGSAAGGTEGNAGNNASNFYQSSTTLYDPANTFSGMPANLYGYSMLDLTDGSYCRFSSTDTVGTNSITCSAGLAGGTHNYWSNGDRYIVSRNLSDDYCTGYPPLAAATFTGTYSGSGAWGPPGGTSVDGNLPGQEGYPCIDQIGRSPNASGTLQTLSPQYDWGNDYMGNYDETAGLPNWACLRMTTYHVLANRDYYDGTSTNSHFKSGQDASKPSTCSKGDAYWAKDDNTLYQCGASNNWRAYFTPYPYPYPSTVGTHRMKFDGGAKMSTTGGARLEFN